MYRPSASSQLEGVDAPADALELRFNLPENVDHQALLLADVLGDLLYLVGPLGHDPFEAGLSFEILQGIPTAFLVNDVLAIG